MGEGKGNRGLWCGGVTHLVDALGVRAPHSVQCSLSACLCQVGPVGCQHPPKTLDVLMLLDLGAPPLHTRRCGPARPRQPPAHTARTPNLPTPSLPSPFSIQFIIEGMFALRKAGFEKSGFPALKPELDLVEAEDQITHELGLDDELQAQVRARA